MAQYIDLDNRIGINANPANSPWNAQHWRDICREMSGIRGCAPAVHFRNSINDSNQSLVSEDDRIFKVSAKRRIYVWGVEMYAGGYDTLKISWRNLDSSSNFVQIKGTGINYIWDLESSSPYYSSSSWNQDGTGGIGGGTPQNGLSYLFHGGGVPYPAQTWASHSSSPYYYYDPRIYFYENSPLGDFLATYGPLSAELGLATYDTTALNNIRCFTFLKEGEYLLEIDESASPWYNSFVSFNSSIQKDPIQFYNYFVNSPIQYSSNEALYGTPKEWISSDNSFVKNSGQRYRSQFTKKIIIKVYNEDKDLVNNSVFNKTFKTYSPGNCHYDDAISSPYVSVSGYGSEWGGSKIDTSESSFKFIKLKNSIQSNDASISFISSSERFSANIWRYSNQIVKKTINRRHICVDGITISSNKSMFHIDDPDVEKIESGTINSGFDLWYIDLRAATFKNCTFKNIDFSSPKNKKCFSGSLFENCIFENCSVNVFGDSILFDHCTFRGRPGYGNSEDSISLVSSNSCLFLGCNFENTSRGLYFKLNHGPTCDNAIFRCKFNGNVMHDGGGELFSCSYPEADRIDFDKNYYLNGDATQTSVDSIEWTAAYRNEFSRNMFFENRISSSNYGTIGVDSGFSRANFCWGSGFYTPMIIADKCSFNSKSASIYFTVCYCVASQFNMSFNDNTLHSRFAYNTINGLHKKNIMGSTSGYDSLKNIGHSSFGFYGENDRTTSESPWYCRATYSMGNRIFSNQIQCWGREYFDLVPDSTNFSNLACSMSFYHNVFVLKSNPGGVSMNFNQQTLNSDWANVSLQAIDSYDSPSTSDQIGKYVNAAYKNRFYLPTIDNRLQDPFDGINATNLDPSSSGYYNNSVGLCRAIYKIENSNTYRIDIDLWNSLPNSPIVPITGLNNQTVPVPGGYFHPNETLVFERNFNNALIDNLYFYRGE